MSKTIKNVFYEKLSFINLVHAHERAKKGKGTRPEIIRFEMNLESNLTNLLYKIKTGQYRIGKYHGLLNLFLIWTELFISGM